MVEQIESDKVTFAGIRGMGEDLTPRDVLLDALIPWSGVIRL